MKKNTTFILLIIASVVLWISDYHLMTYDLSKIALSLSVLTTSYLFFKLILDDILSKKITQKKTRYTFRKITSLLHIFITSLLVFRIWIPDGTTLVAVYGFIAAAIAFSIQDVFKNFVGGLMIFIKNVYRVGDRITINNKTGDVVDIDIWYTYLLEIQEWVAGDQPTGRVVTVPNAEVISGSVSNYTDDHSFIWDEIHVPITYTSNWKKAEKIIQEIMNNYTADITPIAQKEIKKLEEKYFLSSANTQSNVFIKITDNWISLYGRYVTYARERRILNSHINKAILEAFENESDITIASTTVTVTTTNK